MGTSSAGTRTRRSPTTSSGMRLVTRAARPGADSNSSVRSGPTSETSRSARSTTSNIERVLAKRSSPSCGDIPGAGTIPSVVTSRVSALAPSDCERSIHHTPSVHRSGSVSATSIARRVLPTPPGPSRVTRRCSSSNRRMAGICRSRPMNGVSGVGTVRGGGEIGASSA